MSKSKRHPVKIQEEAEDDLDRIYSFIVRDSPRNVGRFVRTLQKRILSLGEFPRRGSRIKILEGSDSPNEIRFLEHQGYLIFYAVDQKDVTVLHIAGPGMNWVTLFE